MTELESLKYIKLFREEWDANSKTKNAEALDVAIKALEEISLYKQVELCLIPADVYKKQCEELEQYRALGTVEELKELKEKQKYCLGYRSKDGIRCPQFD